MGWPVSMYFSETAKRCGPAVKMNGPPKDGRFVMKDIKDHTRFPGQPGILDKLAYGADEAMPTGMY